MEKKTPAFGQIFKRIVLKSVCLLVIISLNWAGLSAILETFAYFNNSETSQANTFTAGTLDFYLESPADFSPSPIAPGESSQRTITFLNTTNIPKYNITATNFSGELCQYLNLETNLDDGGILYSGSLTSFIYGPVIFETPENWHFTLKLPTDVPDTVNGQTCQFDFVFFGSQTKNDLPFGQGFNDTEEITNNIAAEVCQDSEIRSCGYWKIHSNIYKPHLPQTLGGYPTDEIVDTITKANNILTAACGTCGCGCDKTMRTKLKGQLLAMKFNIAHFGIGEYLVESEGKTLNQIVADADNLLRQDPPPEDSVLEEMKDLLDSLNKLEHIRFCAVTLPPEGCVLQLTKTASSDEVNRGDTITYHLTFDNIGNEVCTGGGVRLKDSFDGNSLKYLEYTSTRDPKSFNKSTNYVEWNFGNIYPDDSLIEIDLKMKVSSCAKCDSTITNSANYWSNETDWGEPVTVDTHVICPPVPDTGIVINEFLPNPRGRDDARKPKGEWVELYNKGSNEIDVAGWVLYDENDSNELPITSANTNTDSTIISAGGFLVVYRNGDNDFALDNKGGDTVRLYDGKISDGANLIDSHTYTINAHEGKSFARIPDGSNDWVDPIPTPGEPNVMDEGVETDFGPALPEEGEKGYEEIKNEEEILAPSETPAEITGGVSGGIGTSEEEPLVEETTNEQPVEEPIVEESTTEETPAEEPVIEEEAPANEETPAVVEETPIIEEPATLPENEILNELSNGNSSVTSPESAPETPSETTSETAPEVPAETPTEISVPAPEI